MPETPLENPASESALVASGTASVVVTKNVRKENVEK